MASGGLERFKCPFCREESGGYEPLLDVWHCTACDYWNKGKPSVLLPDTPELAAPVLAGKTDDRPPAPAEYGMQLPL